MTVSELISLLQALPPEAMRKRAIYRVKVIGDDDITEYHDIESISEQTFRTKDCPDDVVVIE